MSEYLAVQSTTNNPAPRDPHSSLSDGITSIMDTINLITENMISGETFTLANGTPVDPSTTHGMIAITEYINQLKTNVTYLHAVFDSLVKLEKDINRSLGS